MHKRFAWLLITIALWSCSGQTGVRGPKPGSVEALIQELGDPEIPEIRKVADVDKIMARGKAAMEALIANVDNPAQSLTESGPDGKSFVTTVGHQCRIILKFLIQPDETDIFAQWQPTDWATWWEANKGKRLETIQAEVAAQKKSEK
jgi:hypothetical protein